MRVRILGEKTGVMTQAGHRDPGATYSGDDAKMLVAIGKAVEIGPEPIVVQNVEVPDEIGYKTPSGKTVKTRAKKSKNKRGRR